MSEPRTPYGDPKPAIDERVQLDEVTWARFDGTHIIIETIGVDRVRITPLAMARLHWLSGQLSDNYPRQWVIDMEEALKLG